METTVVRWVGRVGKAYTVIFYLAFFFALAGSLGYAQRSMRGSYLYFRLEDPQAPTFFLGAALMGAAGLVWALYALGPLAYSPAQLFWSYPGTKNPSPNIWKNPLLWGLLGAWSLLSFLLSVAFLPLSLAWIGGTFFLLLSLGFFLSQGAASCQLLGRSFPLHAWAGLALISGLVLSLEATIGFFPTSDVLGPYLLGGGIFLLGICGSCLYSLAALKRPLEWTTAYSGYLRSTQFLYALYNLTGAEGYRYYGSSRRFLRGRLGSSSPSLLALAALGDSIFPIFLILVLTIPVAIFYGLGYGELGVCLVISLGVWALGFFYRWLAREWVASLPLRQWLVASYLPTLLGFSAGTVLATLLYLGAMSIIFQLPPTALLVGFCFGLATALGKPNPPRTFNYSNVLVLPSGLILPAEPLTEAFKLFGQLVLVGLALAFLGPWAFLVPLSFLLLRLGRHYLADR